MQAQAAVETLQHKHLRYDLLPRKNSMQAQAAVETLLMAIFTSPIGVW